MEESQSGRQVRDDGRRFVNVRRKRGRRSRLVVVLQEPSQLVLVIQPGSEVLADRAGVLLAQPVVQPLVVRVIETLLLHRPFEIPIDLGQKLKLRVLPSHGLGRLRPEGFRTEAPRPSVRDSSVSQTRMLIWYSEG